jgi:hypothetical protein
MPRPALKQTTVEEICRTVHALGRGVQHNQPEHTRFGQILLEIARQQEPASLDARKPAPPAVLLDTFSRRLEVQLDKVGSTTEPISGSRPGSGSLSPGVLGAKKPTLERGFQESGRATPLEPRPPPSVIGDSLDHEASATSPSRVPSSLTSSKNKR